MAKVKINTKVSEAIIRECEYSPAILSRITKIPVVETRRIIIAYLKSIDVRQINTDAAITEVRKIENLLYERIIYYRNLIDRNMLHTAMSVEKEIKELQEEYSSFNIYQS